MQIAVAGGTGVVGRRRQPSSGGAVQGVDHIVTLSIVGIEKT